MQPSLVALQQGKALLNLADVEIERAQVADLEIRRVGWLWKRGTCEMSVNGNKREGSEAFIE
jgi:hypothetical protein